MIKMNDKEHELFLEYLRKANKTIAYDLVHYIVKDDFIQFLDLLAGMNFKIASRKNLYRDIEYIKIYNYVKNHGNDINAMKCAAKIYNKKLSFIKRAVYKVSKTLEGGGDIDE